MTRTQHTFRLAATFALGLLPSVATGQVVPVEPETPAMTIGPVEVRPRIVFANVGVDNNVFNEFENPKSDFTATISPDLDLSIRPGRCACRC
jgi:hypothetical protein